MEAGGSRSRVISAYDLGQLIKGTNIPSSPNSVGQSQKAKLRTHAAAKCSCKAAQQKQVVWASLVEAPCLSA